MRWGLATLPGGVTARGVLATTTRDDCRHHHRHPLISRSGERAGGRRQRARHWEFAAPGPGITFTTAQTITLTLGGTAQAADYMLSVGGITLSSPYILSLPVGANAVTARLTIVNDTLPEGAETLTVRAVRGTDDLGTVTLTIPTSDTNLPKVTIHAATSGSPSEGTTLAFTLRRTGATDTALPVVVHVGESGAMLGTPPPTPATIAAELGQ